jgi:hypothetical protein
MTTATVETTKQFQSFTWQALKKLTKEIGVQFYNRETQYHRNGYGLRVSGGRWEDDTKLVIEPNLMGDSAHFSRNYELINERQMSAINAMFIYLVEKGYNAVITENRITIAKVGA